MKLVAVILAALVAGCTPMRQQGEKRVSPAEAEAVAILAVRTAERDQKLEVVPLATEPAGGGDYAVSLQRKEPGPTAEHWRVLVHPDRSAEVVPTEPARTQPETLRAVPDVLRGDRRATDEPGGRRVIPSE